MCLLARFNFWCLYIFLVEIYFEDRPCDAKFSEKCLCSHNNNTALIKQISRFVTALVRLRYIPGPSAVGRWEPHSPPPGLGNSWSCPTICDCGLPAPATISCILEGHTLYLLVLTQRIIHDFTHNFWLFTGVHIVYFDCQPSPHPHNIYPWLFMKQTSPLACDVQTVVDCAAGLPRLCKMAVDMINMQIKSLHFLQDYVKKGESFGWWP